MSADTTVEILKQAILLEKRGQAFYSQVAQQASGLSKIDFKILIFYSRRWRD